MHSRMPAFNSPFALLPLVDDLVLPRKSARRFVRPLVDDLAVVARCRVSRLSLHPRGHLFVQLLDLLRFYASLDMDDHSGRQLTEEQVQQQHCANWSAFQLMLFNKVPQVGGGGNARLR